MKYVSLLVVVMVLLANLMFVSTSPVLATDIVEMMQQVDSDKLYDYAKTLQDFGPHPTGSDEANQVAAFIYNEFVRFGFDTEYQQWKVNGLHGKNVIATLPGTTNYTIILSAHYDTITTSPGADDDGSGVSCMLTAAEIFSNYSFHHTIIFAAFSGEEDGLYGSRAFVQSAYENGSAIIADVQLDGVGHAVSAEGGRMVVISANDASLWINGEATQILDTYSNEIELQSESRSYMGSDHRSFIQYGFEGIFLMEYEFNPNWHSAGDTIEHINSTYMAKICKLAIGIVASLSNRDVPIMTRLIEPRPGMLYIMGRPTYSMNDPHIVAIGKFQVEAIIVNAIEPVQGVAFYLGDRVISIDGEPPYISTYQTVALFTHIARVVALGVSHQDSAELEIIVFNVMPG